MSTKTKTNKADTLREALVAEIINQIETNPGTWTKSWTDPLVAGGFPHNATTGRKYRGGNVLWLLLLAAQQGYTENRWATYKQWGEHGAQVRKGEKSTPVLLWKPTKRKVTDPDTGELVEKKSMFATTYNVFNVAQVDVVDDEKFARLDRFVPQAPTPTEDLAHARDFFAPIPAVVQVGNPAFSADLDVVFMPALDDFKAAENYYSTLAHELTHWTGHKSRLNRISYTSWGDEAYAFEELVAELGAAMVAAHLGFEHVTRDDHVAYLAHWVAQIRENNQSLWTAATKASDAFELLVELAEAELAEAA